MGSDKERQQNFKNRQQHINRFSNLYGYRSHFGLILPSSMIFNLYDCYAPAPTIQAAKAARTGICLIISTRERVFLGGLSVETICLPFCHGWLKNQQKPCLHPFQSQSQNLFTTLEHYPPKFGYDSPDLAADSDH